MSKFIKDGKINMLNPIVEIDGDEMTRILWSEIKKTLLQPFINLNTKYYDLSLISREKTNDQITVDCANAIKSYKIGVKCATITPNHQRVKEYDLSRMYASPNGTIRAILDGTVFREPIMVKGIKPYVRGWKKPIIIARHAYGDIYKCIEYKINRNDKVSLKINEKEYEVAKFDKSDGVVMATHNYNASIESFARSCFSYALDKKKTLWFASKDTISKVYDGEFKEVFQSIFEKEYKALFEKAGIEYFYTLIDDVVARVMRSEGDFIWACKNYDGDVMSDMIASSFGSLAMMTSVLVSPNGEYEYEAAHGTVTRHYYEHLKGNMTSTNPVATIFAWSGALYKRGELDKNTKLKKFAKLLEKNTLKTIESGYLTKDLALIFKRSNVKINILNSVEFIEKIASNLSIDFKKLVG